MSDSKPTDISRFENIEKDILKRKISVSHEDRAALTEILDHLRKVREIKSN